MKKLIVLMFTLSVLITSSYGQLNEDFENPLSTWEGVYTGVVNFPSGSWVFDEVSKYTDNGVSDNPEGEGNISCKTYNSITTPSLNTIGTLTFKTIPSFDGTPTTLFLSVEKSYNGIDFTEIASINYGYPDNTYRSRIIDVNDISPVIFIRIINKSTRSQFLINDVSVDSYLGNGTPTSEPSNHAASFAAVRNGSDQVDLTWNDAVGNVIPAGYLLLANKTNVFTSPVDGVDPSIDYDLSDGSACVKIYKGIETCGFTGLEENTTYYFQLYSFTNYGEDIDYKTDGVIPTANATTDQSLPVTLSSFGVYEKNGKVVVEWITESEVNNLGFNLYKSESKNGEFIQINNELIEGAGNSTTKNEYFYIDAEVIPGKTYYYQIKDVAFNGNTEKHEIRSVTLKEKPTVAPRFELFSAYPNPFNPKTHIRFTLSEESNVVINVYNLNGKLINTLISGTRTQGNYEVVWDGTDMNGHSVSNGVYLYQLISDQGFIQTNKVILLK